MMKNSKKFARTSISDLDEDVVSVILERIGSHVSFIRAASACKRWRHVIADAAVLRRFRLLHVATVASAYHNDTPTLVAARESRGPVFVSSMSSSSIDGRRHSIDFLPHGGGGKAWAVVDSRGRLLLMRPHREDVMVVCELLTRRYIEIPLPPAIVNGSGHYIEGSYLINGDAEEAGGCIGISNFRVFFDMCRMLRDDVPHTTAVFTASAGDGGLPWSEKAVDHVMVMVPRQGRAEKKTTFLSPHDCHARVLGTIAGSQYTYLEGGTLVALDCSTGEFSSSQLPDSKYIAGTSARGHDGKPRIFTLFFDEMIVFARTGGSDWRLEKSVRLVEATRGLPGVRRLCNSKKKGKSKDIVP
ncbi:hypothetical protein EJB05_00772, partial [Eragrostis curvula]